MNKIYIVLSFTGTLFSRAIKIRTNKEYSHVSISFDSSMRELYSFGRLYPHLPLPGGFVKESFYSGTFARFNNTKVKIYELEISDENFEKLINFIEFNKMNSKKLKYSYKGALGMNFKKNWFNEHEQVCSSFVYTALDYSGLIDNTCPLTKISFPDDFSKIKGAKLVYEGNIKLYNK